MRLAALTLTALSVACGGPSVGELLSQEVSLTVRAISTDPSRVALEEPDGGAAVSRALISARSLTLLPCNEDVAEIELGPRGYELLAEAPFSEIITTAVQNLCGVKWEIEPAEGEPLYVDGTDSSGKRFNLASDASFSVLLDTDEDGSFGKVPLLLGVDVATWLGDLPLTDDALPDRFAEATALYLDVDEDGVLDDEEREPIVRAHTP